MKPRPSPERRAKSTTLRSTLTRIFSFRLNSKVAYHSNPLGDSESLPRLNQKTSRDPRLPVRSFVGGTATSNANAVSPQWRARPYTAWNAVPVSVEVRSWPTGCLHSRWRRLEPGRQGLLARAHLCNGAPRARLAIGFAIDVTTAWRYVWEAIDLLATPPTTRTPRYTRSACSGMRTSMAP
jgi:hypothetical protein